MRGFEKATQHHKENTGLPYKRFILAKDGDAAELRVLQNQDDWVSIFFHEEFGQTKRTRCLSDDTAKNVDTCGLCADDIKRRLITFIPVRVRGDLNEAQVQFIEAGREVLNEVVSQIEELPEGTDITFFDFKVKRSGVKLETKYKWICQPATKHPLNAAEVALVVPDLETLLPLPDELTVAQRLKQHHQAEDVAPVEAKTGKSRF
jgi:hypothetical protein